MEALAATVGGLGVDNPSIGNIKKITLPCVGPIKSYLVGNLVNWQQVLYFLLFNLVHIRLFACG